MAMPTHQRPSWHLVLPVKGANGAKTRLAPPAGVDRGDLAVAMATDTLRAVCRVVPVRQVHVVTADAGFAQTARRLGASVVADPGGGLLDAVGAGLAAADHGGPTVVLLGDLPALRAGDLREALRLASGAQRSFVADRQGTGTTLLAAGRGVRHTPRFGLGSAAAHEAAGYVQLRAGLPSLRTDVDDADDLDAAMRLGVGPATDALLGAFTG